MLLGLIYLFSSGVMGFFVAGMTTYFTRRRYRLAQAEKAKLQPKEYTLIVKLKEHQKAAQAA